MVKEKPRFLADGDLRQEGIKVCYPESKLLVVLRGLTSAFQTIGNHGMISIRMGRNQTLRHNQYTWERLQIFLGYPELRSCLCFGRQLLITSSIIFQSFNIKSKLAKPGLSLVWTKTNIRGMINAWIFWAATVSFTTRLVNSLQIPIF